MTATMGKTVGAGLLAAVFAFAASLCAQGGGQGQQNPPNPPVQPGQNPPPAKPPVTVESAPPPVNAEEEAAYKTIFEMRGNEAAKLTQLCEEFLKKYPESRYREAVYSRLTNAYFAAGEVDKMLAAGEKALELKKDDVDVLALLALVIPRRVNLKALDANQKLQKAEGYAKQSIELLGNIAKPEILSEQDFTKAKNEKLSMSHSGLGLVYYYRQKYTDAVSEFEQATKLASPPDPVDLFLLGVVLNETKRFADATAAFGRCSEVPGPMQDQCKQSLGEAKKRAATELAPPKP